MPFCVARFSDPSCVGAATPAVPAGIASIGALAAGANLSFLDASFVAEANATLALAAAPTTVVSAAALPPRWSVA